MPGRKHRPGAARAKNAKGHRAAVERRDAQLRAHHSKTKADNAAYYQNAITWHQPRRGS